MSKKHGIAIAVTLLVLAIVLVLSYALTQLGVQSLNHAEANLYSKKAMMAAEAGVAQSLRRLRTNPNWRGEGLSGELTTGPERYSVEFLNNFGGTGPLTASNGARVPAGTSYILSTGTARDGASSRKVGVLVRGDRGKGYWRHALFGYSYVDLGNGQVDSFNSNDGPYSQSRNPKGGIIGTNNPDLPPDASEISLAEKGILVGPVGKVNSVEIGPSGSPQQTASGVNPTIVTNLTSPLARDLERVEPPFSPTDQDLNLRSTTNLSPGAYGEVSVAGNTTVTLSPGTYVFKTLSVSGSAKIQVNQGVVEIYVTGDGGPGDDLKLSGNSLTNTTMVAGNVKVYVGAQARDVTINGGPQVAISVLAPLCDVVFNGTAGGFYGAIIGHSITCNGQPGIHYDEALNDNQGGEVPSAIEILSWQRF